MKLIDEKKVNEFYQNSIFQCEMECIEKSIEFAETELQKLAVEFANWINDNCDTSENKHEWTDWQQTYSSEQLFEIFIKQRETKCANE